MPNKKKYEKPVKIDVSFDEAMKKIVRVDKKKVEQKINQAGRKDKK